MKMEIIAIQGLHDSCQYRCDNSSGKHKQAEETIRHWIWRNFRTRVSEQERLCYDSLVNVILMFERCPPLRLTLEQRRLKVSRLDCYRASGTSSRKNPKMIGMYPTIETKRYKQQEASTGSSTTCVLDVAEHQILDGKHFLIFWCQNQKSLVVEECKISPEKLPLSMEKRIQRSL